MSSDSRRLPTVRDLIEQALDMGRRVTACYASGQAEPGVGLDEDLASALAEEGLPDRLPQIRRINRRFTRPAARSSTRPLVAHPLHVAVELVAPDRADPSYSLFLSLLRGVIHHDHEPPPRESIRMAALRWSRDVLPNTSSSPSEQGIAEQMVAEWAAIRGLAAVELPAPASNQLLGWRAHPLPWHPLGTQQVAQIVNELLGHIPMVQGLPSVLDGGLLPAPSGGLVSLIQGGPGTGKTSLACSLAASLVASSSAVVYLSLEEHPEAIIHRIQGTLQQMEADTEAMELLTILEPEHGPSGMDAMRLDALVEGIVHPLLDTFRDDEPDLLSPFPLALFIDSIDALELRDTGDADPSVRARLDALIRALRHRGILVVLLSGHPTHPSHVRTEYLVDSVFHLTEHGGRRVLELPKFRYQSTRGGAHRLVLRGPHGLGIYPDIQTYWTRLRMAPEQSTHPDEWHIVSHIPRQVVHASARAEEDLDSVRWVITGIAPSGGHIAVLGKGSTGKSLYALELLLAETVFIDEHDPATGAADPSLRRATLDTIELDHAPLLRCALPRWTAGSSGPCFDPRSRVLIVPFVYPEPWYLDLTARLLTQEGFGPSRASIRAEDHVEVAKLYPGRLCAATLLHKIERVLERGYREGRPFTGVLIESIHNVAHAYPHIAEAPELWPVLYAMLRSYGATAVSTFTAFDVGAPDPVWEQMLEPSSAARHLSQLLTARADATVFFRQEGHRILFEMPVPGRLQCPPLLAHTWDRQQGRFDGLLSLDDPPDPQVP